MRLHPDECNALISLINEASESDLPFGCAQAVRSSGGFEAWQTKLRNKLHEEWRRQMRDGGTHGILLEALQSESRSYKAGMGERETTPEVGESYEDVFAEYR